MKRASIRDLHLKTSAILNEISEGEIYIIEERGSPVAELRPVQSLPPARGLPDKEKLLRSFPQVRSDSGRILEEDR